MIKLGSTYTCFAVFEVLDTAELPLEVRSRVDPDTVSLTVTAPSGASTTYTYAGLTVTRVAAGVYLRQVDNTEVGLWRADWTGVEGSVTGKPLSHRWRVVA